MSARDRKLATVLAPLAVFALYWVLLMNPALDRRAALEQPVADAQTARDAAVSQAAELTAAQRRYEADYAELVELSRAIPQSVAVSDLMRELNAAARGTGIDFSNITMGGQAAAEAGDTATAATAPIAPGLDEIPVELTFDGRFFELADLFHSIKRFVTIAGGRLQVRGRLIRIDSFSFESATFPSITARIGATVYAAPAAEGPTGGATPVGPRGAERGDGGLKPVESFSPAAVVPR
jgi:Tfp pilus assembly protein PilO